MLNWLTGNSANPVGLDSSIYWLSEKLEESERKEAANRIALLCLTGLTRMRNEGMSSVHFMRIYKNGEEIALKKYKAGKGTLSEPAIAYIAMSFFLLIPQLKKVDAQISIQKIFRFIQQYADEKMYLLVKNFTL